MKRVIEFRSYQLKPGTRNEFHHLFTQTVFPLLKQWTTDVVDFGPSLHDPDAYYLMRAYDSLDELQSSQDAFYGSDAWRQGPREAILALIDTYTAFVIELENTVIDSLRKAG